jgi:hypothetical protein
MKKIISIKIFFLLTAPIIAETYDTAAMESSFKSEVKEQKAKYYNGRTVGGVTYNYTKINNERDKRNVIRSKGEIGTTVSTNNRRQSKVYNVTKVRNIKLNRGENIGTTLVGDGNMYNKNITNVTKVENVNTRLLSGNRDHTKDCKNRKTLRNVHTVNDTEVTNSNLYNINAGISNRCR